MKRICGRRRNGTPRIPVGGAARNVRDNFGISLPNRVVRGRQRKNNRLWFSPMRAGIATYAGRGSAPGNRPFNGRLRPHKMREPAGHRNGITQLRFQPSPTGTRRTAATDARSSSPAARAGFRASRTDRRAVSRARQRIYVIGVIATNSTNPLASLVDILPVTSRSYPQMSFGSKVMHSPTMDKA